MRACLQASLACACSRPVLVKPCRSRWNTGTHGQIRARHQSTTAASRRSEYDLDQPRQPVHAEPTGTANTEFRADASALTFKARRHASKPHHVCPACGQQISRKRVLLKHFQKCCPDRISQEAVTNASDDYQAMQTLLAEAAKAELKLRHDCLMIAFGQVDDDGQQIKRTQAEVADILHIPESRVRAAMKMASRAIPLVADNEPVQVLYEDDDIIAVNKPAGVTSGPKHRYKGGSIVNRLIGYLGYPPYPVHRLDMMTSGVLVSAKRRQAAVGLAQQFRLRTATKVYLAITAGSPRLSIFRVDAPIDVHPTEEIARAVLPSGDVSLTDFEVISSNEAASLGVATLGLVTTEAMYKDKGAALVLAMPHTGRTHQIRVHLAHAGHAILGDTIYGLQGSWISRQALHAASLSLQHPISGKLLQLTAPLPDDMAAAAQMLGLMVPTVGELSTKANALKRAFSESLNQMTAELHITETESDTVKES